MRVVSDDVPLSVQSQKHGLYLQYPRDPSLKRPLLHCISSSRLCRHCGLLYLPKTIIAPLLLYTTSVISLPTVLVEKSVFHYSYLPHTPVAEPSWWIFSMVGESSSLIVSQYRKNVYGGEISAFCDCSCWSIVTHVRGVYWRVLGHRYSLATNCLLYTKWKHIIAGRQKRVNKNHVEDGSRHPIHPQYSKST